VRIKAPRSSPAAKAQEAFPVQEPEAEALALFERAMTTLQRKVYGDAARLFRELLDRRMADGTLLDRARVYAGLCEREIRKQPVAPRTVEERLTAATLALNNRNDGDAQRLAQSVLAEDVNQDLARYLLAAVAARRGKLEDALTHLQEVIRLNPDVRVQARLDDDFEALRHNEAFQSLTGPPPHPVTQRRARRAR
jgi:tetratricopeptide (TPR) repeat protein